MAALHFVHLKRIGKRFMADKVEYLVEVAEAPIVTLRLCAGAANALAEFIYDSVGAFEPDVVTHQVARKVMEEINDAISR